MPQMSPTLWPTLFIYTIMNIILIALMMHYFMKIKLSPPPSNTLMKKNYTWKW